MIRVCVAAMVACAVASSAASGAVYIPGQFNGWNNNGPQMTETAPGSGIYTASITGQAAGSFQPFALLSIGGDWGSKYIPSGDQWVTANGSGNVDVTFNTNTVNDGWLPAANRVGSSNAETAWTAVGDWQSEVAGGDWDNANPATSMTLVSGSIYGLLVTLPAGTYNYKAVTTGAWNAIGSDSRSINAATVAFTTTPTNNQVYFFVDAAAGTVKVDVIPAPGAAALLGLGGLLAARRRR